MSDWGTLPEPNYNKDVHLLGHKPADERRALFDAWCQTLHRLENGLGRVLKVDNTLPGEDFLGRPLTGYNNVSASYYSVAVGIRAIIAHFADPGRPLKFIDLGCGLGTKGSLARALGVSEAWGVERNPTLAAVAREIGNTVVEGDLRDYVKTPEFREFDIIYWYSPIRDTRANRDLATDIAAHCKADAVLFPAWPWYADDVLDRAVWERVEVPYPRHPRVHYFRRAKRVAPASGAGPGS